MGTFLSLAFYNAHLVWTLLILSVEFGQDSSRVFSEVPLEDESLTALIHLYAEACLWYPFLAQIQGRVWLISVTIGSSAQLPTRLPLWWIWFYWQHMCMWPLAHISDTHRFGSKGNSKKLIQSHRERNMTRRRLHRTMAMIPVPGSLKALLL